MTWDEPIPYRPSDRLPSIAGDEVVCRVRVAGYRVVLTMGGDPYLLTPADAEKLACDLVVAGARLDRLVADTERETEGGGADVTEHTTVRPASRCATEVAGNCPCPTCSGGRPYVAVHADSQFDTARLSVMGVQAGVTLRLSADELMCLAALCTEAAVELRRSQPTRAAHWVN